MTTTNPAAIVRNFATLDSDAQAAAVYAVESLARQVEFDGSEDRVLDPRRADRVSLYRDGSSPTGERFLLEVRYEEAAPASYGFELREQRDAHGRVSRVYFAGSF